jgi:hypothetical protein
VDWRYLAFELIQALALGLEYPVFRYHWALNLESYSPRSNQVAVSLGELSCCSALVVRSKAQRFAK